MPCGFYDLERAYFQTLGTRACELNLLEDNLLQGLRARACDLAFFKRNIRDCGYTKEEGL